MVRFLISSALAGAGLIFPSIWGLAPIGLALFFATLRQESIHLRHALCGGLLFGLITAAAGTVWFLDTLPLDFLGIDNQRVQVTAVVMTWMYVSLSLAAPVPLAAAVLGRYRRTYLFPLIAGVVWAVTEVARMWSFAVTTYGPQSLFGPHFSAAAIGYPLTENNFLLQLADPFGLHALNFVTAFTSGLLASVPTTLSSRKARVVLGSQALAFLALIGICRTTSSEATASGTTTSLRFAVISENITTVRDESTHDVALHGLSSAAALQPAVDVILLPEELSLTSIFWSKDEYRSFVDRYVGTRDVLIVNSRNELFPADENNQLPEYKKLVYDSTSRGELGRYTKQMLMPLGEYAPSFTKTFFSLIKDPTLQSYINELSDPKPPPRPAPAVGVFKGIRIGGLLCSDLFSPSLYRSLVRDQGAQVLINLANHFWFHGSHPLYWKTLQMARLHAVQNRLPLLMANNVAPSLIVDAHGKTTWQSSWGERGARLIEVPLRTQ